MVRNIQLGVREIVHSFLTLSNSALLFVCCVFVCFHRGAVGSEWGVQLLVMWPLAYICFCSYFALFR